MPSLRMFIHLTMIFGFFYPILITAIGQLTMEYKADGSFLVRNGQIVGSKWIGQNFQSDRYFKGRPSAVNNDPLPSGGSNLGPTSAELQKRIASAPSDLPAELVYSSGSGLDPHISPEAARYQIPRIMQARGISNPTAIEQLIEQHTQQRFLGFIGEPIVNVLQLNLDLDKLTNKP